MRRIKVAAAIAGVAAIAVAGCTTGGSGTNPTPSQTIAKDKMTTDPSAVGPAAEIAGAKKGGTVTVYSQSTPTGFDPSDIYYTDSGEIAKLFFRTPTQFDIRNGNPVLVPDLTDLGTVSADNLNWTFKLKSGMKYADGSDVKVDDLAYAIKRSFAHEVFANGPTYQNQYFKDGQTYKGPAKYGKGDGSDGYTDTYSGVETPDATTLVIHLAKAFPALPYYMTFPLFTPIPAAKDTKTDYQNNPMATGPYQFDSFTAGSELKLKKNPNWDANSDPARHQYVDAFDFRWGGDDVKTQQQVLSSNNDADAASVNYADIDASLIPSLTGKESQFVTGTASCTIAANIDTRKITDIKVRKAIAMAYPYDDWFKTAGLSSYTAERAHTILPPSVPGYKNYDPLPFLNGKGNGDAAGAKALLTEANAVGFELSWYYDNTKTIPQQVSNLRQAAFEAAGFKVHAIGVNTAEFRRKRGDYTAPVNLFQTGANWCSDWPAGSSWFPVLFETHSVADGQSYGFQQDAALDAEIEAINVLPADQAAAKWGDLDKKILGNYVGLPLYYTKTAIVVGSKIGGAAIDGTQGMPNFVQMFVK